MLNQAILACEHAYIACFTDTSETADIIRFRDVELKDMYYHNCTYIKQSIDDIDLKQKIEGEISFRLSEKETFCNILLNSVVGDSLLSMLECKPEVSNNGYYAFDTSKLEALKALPGCTLTKVDSQNMIEDVLYCDLQLDEATLGKDFCTRRCYRRGKVYCSDNGVDSYNCYHHSEIVGNCNLFIHEGVAKIADFTVIHKYQRMGYGTTILKELIGIAMTEKCHTIYLVTDEDDTAKEMYLKIGFHKIAEKSDLFFRL